MQINRQSLTGGLRSKAAKKVIQLHRLLVFEQTFQDYLEGKASANQVKDRANKMLAVGLPEKLK